MQSTTHIRTKRSYLLTVDNYFPADYANNLFHICKNLDLIVEPPMRLGTAHRCMNFYSNESEGYEFSNQIMVACPVPDPLMNFMTTVNRSLSTDFNGLLINYYRDGTDNLGSHADREKELSGGMVVAFTMMNPGGHRIFRIRDYDGERIFDGSLYKDIITKHNQLLIMGGAFQKEFKHEVPAEKSNHNAERVSITLRSHKK